VKNGWHLEQISTRIFCFVEPVAITSPQAGFTNAVAALGTSFTAEHAHLIARYANEVVLIFDADSAGQKGTQRAIGMIRETGVNIRVVSIPDGKDPDEFIRKNGAERFKLLLERSANDVEYRLMELGGKHLLNTADGRVAYLRDASALLSGLSSPIERDVYAGKLATELSVSKEAILSQVNYTMGKIRKNQKDKQLSQIVRNSENTIKKANPEASKHVRAVSAEEGLLGLLILNPDFISPIASKLSPDFIITAFNRRVYQRLVDRHQNGLLVELAFLSADFDEDEMGYVSRLVRDARERANSLDEAKKYADIIISEQKLMELDTTEELSPDQIQQVLAVMREHKK